ncbi:hypothetical protein M0812_08883 [Anaeramoeba flamelloides]|uniref:PAS domain-containing protein n=1 Tax=Anaeramoeba flamelloides TaxID=1746091 RepID=A0AAV7ZYE0_9EUKA|nr:hypothetical protein M0812_08883 [Anaeramoeba flamelloides]
MGNKSFKSRSPLTVHSRNSKKFFQMVDNSKLCLALLDLDFRIKFLNRPYCDFLQISNTKTIFNKTQKELLECKEPVLAPYQPYYNKETLKVIVAILKELLKDSTITSIATYQVFKPKIHYVNAQLKIRKIKIGTDWFFLFFAIPIRCTPKINPFRTKKFEALLMPKRNIEFPKIKYKNKKKHQNKNKNKNKNKYKRTLNLHKNNKKKKNKSQNNHQKNYNNPSPLSYVNKTE